MLREFLFPVDEMVPGGANDVFDLDYEHGITAKRSTKRAKRKKQDSDDDWSDEESGEEDGGGDVGDDMVSAEKVKRIRLVLLSFFLHCSLSRCYKLPASSSECTKKTSSVRTNMVWAQEESLSRRSRKESDLRYSSCIRRDLSFRSLHT